MLYRNRYVGPLDCLHFSSQCVCPFTFDRSFYPSTSSTTSVRADSSVPEELQAVRSQNYATAVEILLIQCYAVSRVHNAMPRVIILDTTGTTEQYPSGRLTPSELQSRFGDNPLKNSRVFFSPIVRKNETTVLKAFQDRPCSDNSVCRAHVTTYLVPGTTAVEVPQ